MFPLPLVVSLGDSPLLRAGLTGLYILAGTALWLAKLPMVLQLGLSVLLLLSWWPTQKPQASITLRCHQDGKLEQQTETGWVTLQRDGVAVLLPGLILQRHKVAAKMRPKVLLIAADGLASEDWRRLKVWFRLLGAGDKSKGVAMNEL